MPRASEPELDGATVVEQGTDPLLGTVINGKFRILRSIARGGMGRIYYATQVPFERPVALKVVQADTVNEEESQFLKRFLQEASILAKLQHPNVVMLFDYGRIEPSKVERYFIAMEYLAGETLGSRFKSHGPMPTRDVLVLTRQILRGLREAHKIGIVHRDLKPSNIILVPDGDGEIVKLVDFGIGKVIHKGELAQDLTQEGVMVGTPRYMAPEQFDGAASTASDLYALGTILYQALAGQLPFRGSTLGEFMVAKLTHPIPRLREVQPICDAPESLEALVFALLARAPQDRPPLDVVFSQLSQIEEEVFGTPHSLRRGSISGSSPVLAPPSSRSAVQQSQRLLVPYTVVGSIPPSVPPMLGVTPRPMATTHRPPPTGGRGLAAAVMVLLGVALVGFAGVAWWAKARSDARLASAASATISAPPAISSGPAAASPFVLTIDSTPPGATVTEDDRTIGETPVQIPIDHESVASGMRTFVVKKDGFLASNVQQGESQANVKSVVALAPDPSTHVKSHPGATKQGGGATTAGKQQPAQSNTGSLDIRMNR
ncbi:MAG TPA: serine/threonine-protein kinase [Labilithrix sp.]|jgi:serine/threonine-protein kinase